MASELHIIVVGDADVSSAAALLSELESHWSRFIVDSDITALNNASGRPVRVHPSTITLITTMIDGWRLTDHAFDPSVLQIMCDSGYRSSIDDPYKVTLLPDGAMLVGGYDEAPAMDAIVIDAATSTVRLPLGLAIDPGGVGKGLAADLAVRHLLDNGAAGALVSIGGDMAMAGTPPEGTPGWSVAVENPDTSLGNACLLEVEAGGVATSSTRSRRWVHDGRERHHVIDPLARHQSTTDLATVTVIGRAGWLAEVHATAGLLAGTGGVLDYLERNELSGIAIDLDGRLIPTSDLSSAVAS
jgi:thiamine biosynthesis lipoprotein